MADGMFLNPLAARQAAMQAGMISPQQLSQQGLLQQITGTMANAGTMIGGGVGGLFGAEYAPERQARITQEVMQQAGRFASPLAQAQEAYKLFQQQGMTGQAQEMMKRIQELQQQANQEARAVKQDEVTSLQFEKAKMEMEATKKAMEQAPKNIEARKKTLSTLFPDMEQEAYDAVAQDKELFKSLVAEKYKYKDIPTKVVTANGRVSLINGQTGAVVSDLGEAPKPQQVNIDLKGEGAFVQQRGKDQATTLKTVLDERRKAQSSLVTLDSMSKEALQGLYSGPQAQVVLNTNNFLESVGLLSKEDTQKLTNSTKYDKLAKDLVMQDLDGKLGAQVSDADRKYVEARIPQLTTNPQARIELIAKLKEIANRKIAYADQMEEYANVNKNLNNFKFVDPYKQTTERAPLSSFRR